MKCIINWKKKRESKKKMYECVSTVESEILYTTYFDESSDLGTTYLGKWNESRLDKSRAEETYPIKRACLYHR